MKTILEILEETLQNALQYYQGDYDSDKTWCIFCGYYYYDSNTGTFIEEHEPSCTTNIIKDHIQKLKE